MSNNLQKDPLKLSLLFLRLGVFIVFFMWTVDKFINPSHSAAIFANFYSVKGLSEAIVYAIGSLQLIIVLMFLLGVKKRISYGIILVMHLFSTLSSFSHYLNPWASPNLLFFAAWPMLAAIAALYLLRDEDTLFTIGK